MIYRTYECSDCECVFEVACNSSDPDPSCPNPDCGKVLEWKPKSFAITGVKAKAIDLAQDILEKDYGLSNFKDNNKPGEVGIVRNHETAAETHIVNQTMSEMRQQLPKEQIASFWGQNAGPSTGMQSMTGQSLIQMAKVGAQGVDPMAMLHKGVKEGKIPTTRQMTSVLARADMTGKIVK